MILKCSMAFTLNMKRDWSGPNKRKREKYLKVFGIPCSTLKGRLIQKVIYNFFKLRDGIYCRRCGEPVEIGDHSLDHDTSFWDAKDPWVEFFDLDKCFMSHKSCNFSHGAKEKCRMFKDKHRTAQGKKDMLRGLRNGSGNKGTSTDSE